jgi:hypothetical protein
MQCSVLIGIDVITICSQYSSHCTHHISPFRPLILIPFFSSCCCCCCWFSDEPSRGGGAEGPPRCNIQDVLQHRGELLCATTLYHTTLHYIISYRIASHHITSHCPTSISIPSAFILSSLIENDASVATLCDAS